jgi:hypothetical protein
MTKKRAQRLTGFEIRELAPERGLVAVGAFEGEKLVVKGVGRADFLALRAVVRAAYLFNSRKAMEQHGWRTMPVEPTARDSSPPVPLARRDASHREPGAGVPRLS